MRWDVPESMMRLSITRAKMDPRTDRTTGRNTGQWKKCKQMKQTTYVKFEQRSIYDRPCRDNSDDSLMRYPIPRRD